MKKPNKKFYFVLSLLVVVVAVMVGIYIFFVNKIDCKKSSSDAGWICHSIKDISTKESLISDCEDQDGVVDAGTVLPAGGYYFSCVIPFADGGQVCSNSEECSGGCEVSSAEVSNYCQQGEGGSYSCSSDLKGFCTNQEYEICSPWFELNDNEVTEHSWCLMDY
jgi:hypothetical protein